MSIRYSFCTLVTDKAMYQNFKQSAVAAGFEEGCEFIVTDNTGPSQLDAYSGLNEMLGQAKGEFVVLCHQDVLLEFDDRADLERRLEALSKTAPHWGVCGVAGVTKDGQQSTRITDKFGANQDTGDFPKQVVSLDECFLIIRRDTGTRFSRDVEGFHLYGTDVCLVAATLGYQAYVIDFHLNHLGSGNMHADYYEAAESFRRKWCSAMQDRYLRTTAAPIFLTGRTELPLFKSIRRWVARKRQKSSWN